MISNKDKVCLHNLAQSIEIKSRMISSSAFDFIKTNIIYAYIKKLNGDAEASRLTYPSVLSYNNTGTVSWYRIVVIYL